MPPPRPQQRRASTVPALDRFDAGEEELLVELQRARHGGGDLVEELNGPLDLGLPLVEIDVRRLVDLLVRDVEAGQIEIARLRHPTEDRLLAADAEARA